MKIITTTLLAFILCFSVNSQISNEELNKQYNKAMSYDYMNHNYKYLDEDFNVIMTSEIFDSLAQKNEYFIEKITKYKDSLSVALCGEFDTWPERNIALHHISMTWLRIGYILWLSEDEAELLGLSYDFKMPYSLYEYFYKQEDNWDRKMTKFVKSLRKRVYEKTQDEEVLEMTHKKLFNYALVNNPIRIADFEKFKNEKEASTNDGCGKPNCCQTKGSTREKCDK